MSSKLTLGGSLNLSWDSFFLLSEFLLKSLVLNRHKRLINTVYSTFIFSAVWFKQVGCDQIMFLVTAELSWLFTNC